MSQRTKVQLELEKPYEEEKRLLTVARFTAIFLTELQNQFACPPDYEHALTLWSQTHPAVGPSDLTTYRSKWTKTRITAQDMPSATREPLQSALEDYASCLLSNVLYDDVPIKTENIMQVDRRIIWRYLHRQLAPGQTPKGHGTNWWVTFKLHPVTLDLIDRNKFAQALYYRNLIITGEQPLQTDCTNIFDYYALRKHPNYTAATLRDEEGRFTDDPYYENPD